MKWSEPSPAQIKHCYAPTVLKDGDTYLLWYTDVEKEWCIRHARSSDGRNWYASRPKPPFTHKYFALCTAVWAGPK